MKKWNEIIKTTGSPAYIFDVDELNSRIQRIKKELPSCQICFAMKANPFLIQAMAPVIDAYEVCSPGEFAICENAKIPMDKIILSGVNKEEKDLLSVMENYKEQGVYTVESSRQLSLLQRSAKKQASRIRVLLRLTSKNQFGMDADQIEDIVKNKEQYPNLEIIGLQFYSGTQKKKRKQIQQEIQMLDTFLIHLLEEYDFSMQRLEYGPGFYVPYFQEEENEQDSLLKDFSKLLSEMQFSGEITLEMGRFIAAYCGYYVTRVEDIKENDGQRYAIVDGGIHQINYYGQMMAMKLPYFLHIYEDFRKEIPEKWNICGSLCTVADVLVKQLPLVELKVGDHLVFERTGAYSVTEGIALFLSRDLPKVYLYEEAKGLVCLRDRQEARLLNQ